MRSGYWQLPGLHDFVLGVRSDLLSGNSVLIANAAWTPTGLAEALELSLRDNEMTRWRRIDGARGRTPLQCVANDLLFRGSDDALEIGEIVSVPELQGAVIWLDGVAGEETGVWLEFVQAYAAAARHDRGDAPCFALSLPPDGSALGQLAGPRVAVRATAPIVRPSDTAVMVAGQIDTNHPNRILAVTHRAVAIELGGGDLVLAGRIADEDLRAVVDVPRNLLVERAAELGWQGGSSDSTTVEQWDGRRRTHSSALAVRGHWRAIEKRVWRGQVQALFPALEELRIALVQEARPFLRLPFQTAYGVIEDPADLEISHLSYMLDTARAPRRLLRRARAMKQIRHRLAHLRPASSEQLFDESFAEACRMEVPADE